MCVSLFSDSIYLADCAQPILIGNGFCNDETNVPECIYDGGDCCISCLNTDYCTNCTCIEGATENFNEFVPQNPLIGDGFCNDETNNYQCYYDGLDCCRSPINTALCSNCSCHGEWRIQEFPTLNSSPQIFSLFNRII